ncbi:hypothetical protein OK074_8825 [Actinobacteria bacterium OK074]|nr:hypothetical protein OK074_8825 [Actinobacteria bacterium OK074]
MWDQEPKRPWQPASPAQPKRPQDPRQAQPPPRAWDFDEPRPFYRQRSWQLSAAFLGVIVVVAGIVALTTGGDDGRTGAAGRPASPGPMVVLPGAQGGRPEGCATDDSAGDALPTAAPDDVRWRDLSGTGVPVSASAGPKVTDGPVWWCFAHTPTGAALAAHVIPSQMSGPNWRTAADQQVVAGRGRDLFVSQRTAVGDVPAPDAGSAATYAGFSVTSYKSSAAAVALLIKSSSGYSTTSINLRWSGGDWKVVPGADGSLHTQVTSVAGPTGFLLWGA